MVKTGCFACLALALIALAGSPALAQGAPADPSAAPAATSSAVSAEGSPTASAAVTAPEDSLPPITVQIEPPPISISSSMIGVAGPLGAKAIEGNPIFAEFVTQQHQDFADGNRIARTTASTIYRDAQGRIRRESQLSVPGLPAGIASANFITIVDRRRGCGWVLNPQEMVAHRYQLGGPPSYVARLNAQGGARLLSRDAKSTSSHGMDFAGGHHWRPHTFPPSVRLSQDDIASPAAMSSGPTAAGAAQAANARPEETGLQANRPSEPTAGSPGAPQEQLGSPAVRIDQPFLAAPNPVRTENLGEEMILGYRAHGKRVITTLPSGEIGNDRSIDIISEQWYSPELELVMRSMHRDPWGGEFTTTVTRIRRGEQPAHLFTVSSKYKVIDAETEGAHHVLDTEGSRGNGSAPW